MQLFAVCRTKKRDWRRITEYMRRKETEWAKSLITEIKELDQEADRLSDMLEEYVKDKRKRDFEILLLKGGIEKREKYPLAPSRRCWVAQALRRRRCEASAGSSMVVLSSPASFRAQTQPEESRIQGGDGTCRQNAEPRGFSGNPIGICRQQMGYPAGYPAGMTQDILQGYPTGCTHHSHWISC